MVDHTKEAPTRRRVRWLTLLGSASFITLWAPSCLYDDSKPCGDDLSVYGDNLRCVCPEGSINSPTGCVKCGPNQIAQGPMCVCDEGFMMGADGVCAEIPTGGPSSTTGTPTGAGGTGGGAGGSSGGGGEGGDSAESSTTETATTTSSTTGSTPDCTVNEDCEVTQICDAGVCRLPTGWGTECTTNAECAGFEADYCDTFQSKCTVSNCSNVPDTCPAGYDCCDLTGFALAIMCIPTGPYCSTPAP